MKSGASKPLVAALWWAIGAYAVALGWQVAAGREI